MTTLVLDDTESLEPDEVAEPDPRRRPNLRPRGCALST